MQRMTNEAALVTDASPLALQQTRLDQRIPASTHRGRLTTSLRRCVTAKVQIRLDLFMFRFKLLIDLYLFSDNI